jgi:hypothetical protein
MAEVTKAQWKARQNRLNLFTDATLKGVGKLRLDGVPGPATRKRIRHCKFWLGWDTKNIDGTWNDKFAWHLRYPRRRGRGKVRVSLATVRRGIQRRLAHNVYWLKSHSKSGVTTYDGVRVARWMVPYLDWARAHGWRGRLVSGYRDPAYSERLCYAICGAPRCPGLCAGRTSNHSGDVKPAGAVDVSYYYDFRYIIARCPYGPKLVNHLSRDPVHFSVSGS